jgi:hypothetical protein
MNPVKDPARDVYWPILRLPEPVAESPAHFSTRIGPRQTLQRLSGAGPQLLALFWTCSVYRKQLASVPLGCSPRYLTRAAWCRF